MFSLNVEIQAHLYSIYLFDFCLSFIFYLDIVYIFLFGEGDVIIWELKDLALCFWESETLDLVGGLLN